nr:MAG TPA: hypothetical protein [Caudoviricetes sp.]
MRGGGFGVFGFEGGEFLGHRTEFGLEVVDLGFLLVEFIHEAQNNSIRLCRCNVGSATSFIK